MAATRSTSRSEISDATPAFVAHLRDLGLQVRRFNALTDTQSSSRDLILANAVLLHFNRDEFGSVLAKMANALEPDGRFAFSLERGDSEEWSGAKLSAPFLLLAAGGSSSPAVAGRFLAPVHRGRDDRTKPCGLDLRDRAQMTKGLRDRPWNGFTIAGADPW